MFSDLTCVEEDRIDLSNIDGETLKSVIAYCEHHKDDPLPDEDAVDEDENYATEPSSWDKSFINVDQGKLFNIIMAANYLDISSLLDLGCRTVADMIKGKSAEEIRKQFKIINDFTPEEEEQIRKENEWAEDR